MRIVLASIRYPPSPGGAESHVAALAEGLVKRGHEVVVHTSDLHTEYPFEKRDLPTEVNGVKVVRHEAKRLLGAWTRMPTMKKALDEEAARSNLVHAHSYGYYQTVVAAKAAKHHGRPFVLTPHYHPPWSMEGGGHRKMLRKIYDRTLGAGTLKRADRIVFVSQAELDTMREHHTIPDAKIIKIPNGFHGDHFKDVPPKTAFRKRVGIEDHARLVLYAGRLASNKGLRHLLPAFQAVAREREDARLVLVGEDQGHREGLQKLADELNISKVVTFTGLLPEDQYLEALAAADVLVLPSEWEAFGIVLVEAMASGVPVIATKVGGAQDVVAHGKTGLLVPYGDERALTDAMHAILDNPIRRQSMGELGRARAFHEFSWDAVVDRTLKLYEDTLTHP